MTTGVMRALIRHSGSALFLADNKWVLNRLDALNFMNSLSALHFADKGRLKDIEIVLDFGNPRYDVVLHVV